MRATVIGAALLLATSAGAAPPNDACDAATPLALPFVEIASAAGALLDPDEPPTACAAASSGSVWYALDVPADGELSLATTGSDYDTVVSVYEGSCGALVERGCDDDDFGILTSRLSRLPVSAGETLLVRVAAYAAHEPGTLVLTGILGAPANDQCHAAVEVAELPFLDETTNLGADETAIDPDGEDGCPDFGATIWYRFTPDREGVVVADTAGSPFDTVLAAYDGTCEAPELLTCNDDSASLQAAVGVPVAANVPVLFEVGGLGDYYPAVGPVRFRLVWATSPPNDTCEGAAAIEALPAAVEQFVPGATRDALPGNGCGTGSASVWYEIVTPAGGVLQLDTEGSDYDTVLDAYSGSCDAAVLRDCNDDVGGPLHSLVAFGVAAGERIRIAVSAYGGGAGRNLVLNARLGPCAADADCRHPDVCTAESCVEGGCRFVGIPGCCGGDADCDDGDPCTTDGCTANACVAMSEQGLDLASCRLLDDPATCGPDALPDRLRRGLARRLARAADLLGRGEAATRPHRARRLLRRGRQQIRKATRKVERAAGRGRVTAECAAALRAALAPPPLSQVVD